MKRKDNVSIPFVNPELVWAGYYIEKLNQFREENPNIEIEDISIGDDSKLLRQRLMPELLQETCRTCLLPINGFPLAQWV